MDAAFMEIVGKVQLEAGRLEGVRECKQLRLSSDEATFPATLAILCLAQLNYPGENLVARWARAACDASIPNTEKFCRMFSVPRFHFYETRGATTVLMGPTYDGKVVHEAVSPLQRRSMIAHFLKLLVARLVASAGWRPLLPCGNITPPGEEDGAALPGAEYLIPQGQTMSPPFLASLVRAWPVVTPSAAHEGSRRPLAQQQQQATGTFTPDAALRAQDIADLEDLPPCLGEIVAAGRRRKLGYHERILLTSCLAQVVVDDNQLVELWQGLDRNHGNRKDHIKDARIVFRGRAKLHYGCAKMIEGTSPIKCPLVSKGTRCSGCSPMLPENFLKRALLAKKGKI